MTAHEDPELIDWLLNAAGCGVMRPPGDFLLSLAIAGLRADWENYEILRPALLTMKGKYPAWNVRIVTPEEKKT